MCAKIELIRADLADWATVIFSLKSTIKKHRSLHIMDTLPLLAYRNDPCASQEMEPSLRSRKRAIGCWIDLGPFTWASSAFLVGGYIYWHQKCPGHL